MRVVNPYLPSWEYVPDGEPYVFGDRLYLFGSHDRFGGKEYCENDYVCWSAPVDDLSDWRLEGIIYRREQDPFCKGKSSHMYAPDVARGPDGRYYLYYGLDFVNRIAVAVSSVPAGPYQFYGEVQYPDGTRYGGRDKELFRFDPAVLVDGDGEIYLYTGFCPKDPWFQTVAKRENITIDAMGSQVAQLAEDMRTILVEPVPLVPGVDNSTGTGFEGHEFYEASSIRKFGRQYYFIYSSFLSHELAYAVSDRPDGGFRYQGPLHSNGNIGFSGETDAQTFWGNNHGSVEWVNGAYYVFGHRQTGDSEFNRQGVAEPIQMDGQGRFAMAEMTSGGLGGPLSCGERYEAGIACVLRERYGACKITEGNASQRKQRIQITQDGPDREKDPGQYIANIKDGCMIGYKYFDFQNAGSISVVVRGTAQGQLLVYTSPEANPIGILPIFPSQQEREVETSITMGDGISPLYLRFQGAGKLDLLYIQIKSSPLGNA